MKPTCGPLPWPIATRQPSATSAAMWRLVSSSAAIWSGTVWCCLSLISELPPIATTMSGLVIPVLPGQRPVLHPIGRSGRDAGPRPDASRSRRA